MLTSEYSRGGLGGILEDRPRPRPDVSVVLLMVALMCLGSLMIYTSTSVRLDQETGDPTSAVRRQAIFAVVAFVAYIVTSRIDYRHYRRYTAPMYISTLLLLIMALFAAPQNGASRWIPIGGWQFQPSEFAKIALIVVMAGYLSSMEEEGLSWRRLAGTLVIAAVPGFLIFLQPDLGTMLVLGCVLVGMLFVARSTLRQMIMLTSAGLVGILVVLQLDVLRSYQASRLAGFFDQSSDLQGVNWNLHQSRIAIGSGQLFGRGLGQGTQTSLNFIPSQTTDFIFTAVGEQFGFIGAAAVLVVYSLLVWKVLLAAVASPNLFGSLIAVGVASMLAFHVFVNIGMTIGVVPVTGLPLPFMSAGGSAMIAMAAGLGMVNSVLRSRNP